VCLLLAVAALTVWSVWLRTPGLDPRSLWQDDQWVGIVARRMTLGDYWMTSPPVPPGFVVVLGVVGRVFADPEWPLQMVPLACGVAQVPLIAWLTLRLTGSASLSVLAAALLVADPLLSDHLVRVKQYSLESLVTILLLLLGTWVAERPERRRTTVLAVAACLAILFSFSAVFVGGALILAFLVNALVSRPRPDSLAGMLIPSLTFAGGVAVVCFPLLAAARPSLVNMWGHRYLPITNPDAVLSFIVENGAAFVRGQFPPALSWAGALTILGLGLAAVRPSTRWVGLAGVVLVCELLAASALKAYPFGGGRTDVFSHGLTIVLACLPIALLIPSRKAPRVAANAVVVVAALVVVTSLARPTRYPPRRDAELVHRIQETLRSDDGLLLHPSAALAAGYYWQGQIRVHPYERLCGFVVDIVRPGAMTLRIEPWRLDVADVASQLEPFLSAKRPRIFYLGPPADRDETAITAMLQRSGYRPTRATRTRGTALITFERS
jgi:hypothetical protein